MYTDVTVRWGLSAVSDEPAYLPLALQDTNWKAAMDEEIGALAKK
jgi:hypothetical protein